MPGTKIVAICARSKDPRVFPVKLDHEDVAVYVLWKAASRLLRIAVSAVAMEAAICAHGGGHRCTVEHCTKVAQRGNVCSEHRDWYSCKVENFRSMAAAKCNARVACAPNMINVRVESIRTAKSVVT
jgi:hypothetical protein